MKMLRAFMLMSAVALGGCSSTGQVVNPFANGTLNVTSIQNAAVAACGFLPTAASVASIIATVAGGAGGGVALQSAEAVAAAICQAVLPVKQAGRLGAAQPTVNGVPIHGKFVK